MIDIEHHQAIQMTVCESAMSEGLAFLRLGLVELIAAINECHGIVLDFLRKGQQFFCVRLFSPCLLCSFPFQVLLLQQELLIVCIIQPRLYRRHALSLTSLHRGDDGPAGINAPCGVRLPDLLPELFLCTRKSLGEMCVFLKCDHRQNAVCVVMV